MTADDKALDFAGFQKPICRFIADATEHFTHLLDIDYIGIFGEQQFIGYQFVVLPYRFFGISS